MHQEAAVPNSQWYKGKWTNKHGGVHVRLCAFFMKQFSLTNTFSGGNATALMSNPTTTVGQTTYTSGVSWTLGGSVTGGYANGSGQLLVSANGGVTVSNTQSRDIKDVDIQNQGNGKNTAWNIEFNNLASYNKDISINEPALPSRSTQMLYTDWVWRVPGTTDNSRNTYSMTVNLTGTKWGGSKFYTTGADFGTTYFTPAVAAQTAAITPPNRTPTGALNVINDTTAYINSIDIWAAASSAAGAPSYSQKSVLGKGEEKAVWLPAGNYKARLQVGSTYYYTTRNFDLTARGVTIDTHAGDTAAGGDFTDTKPVNW
jgi:hypothetical protein